MATSPEVAASLSCEISHQILDSKLLKIHLLVAFCMQQYWNLLHTAVLESFAYSGSSTEQRLQPRVPPPSDLNDPWTLLSVRESPNIIHVTIKWIHSTVYYKGVGDPVKA